MRIKTVGLFVVLLVAVASCDDIFEEMDISTEVVTLLAPQRGSVLEENNVNFNWALLSGATSYTVQIAKPSFENAAQILLDSTVVQDTLGYLKVELTKTLLNGKYEWRIKGENSGYETVYTQSDFTVLGDEDVDIIPPNRPVLKLPANNSVQSATAVNFSWTRDDVSGSAERDSIFIFSDENLETLQEKGIGANKTYTTTLASNTYYWVVKAYDVQNESEASLVFKLTID